MISKYVLYLEGAKANVIELVGFFLVIFDSLSFKFALQHHKKHISRLR